MSLPDLIEAFSTRLRAEIEPLSMTMGAMTLSPRRPGVPPRHVMAQVGPGATPVSLTVTGWGGRLETREMRMETALDSALGVDGAVDLAIAMLQKPLSGQRMLHGIAAGVGIDAPLQGEELLSTAHLMVDPDAVATLVAHLGSPERARRWVEQQMQLHLDDDRPYGSTSGSASVIRLVRDRIHLPFMLSPLTPARGAGDTSSPLWEDDTIYLQERLPETVADAVTGRRVDALISGSPVGHRLITTVSVPTFGPTDTGDTLVLMETPRVRIDTLLPPKDAT